MIKAWISWLIIYLWTLQRKHVYRGVYCVLQPSEKLYGSSQSWNSGNYIYHQKFRIWRNLQCNNLHINFYKTPFNVSRIESFWLTDGRTQNLTDGRLDHPIMRSFLSCCANPINSEQPEGRCVYMGIRVNMNQDLCYCWKRIFRKTKVCSTLNKEIVDPVKQILTLIVGWMCRTESFNHV